MAISLVIFLVFGLFIGVEEAIDISEALYWGAGPLANGGRMAMEWVPFWIGERRPFWGATSILGEGFLS